MRLTESALPDACATEASAAKSGCEWDGSVSVVGTGEVEEEGWRGEVGK